MSFSTIFQCANDGQLQNRVTACVAQEGASEPVAAMSGMMWPIATSSDIAAAYESAILAGNANPGGDPAVITDQMILSKVQAIGVPAS